MPLESREHLGGKRAAKLAGGFCGVGAVPTGRFCCKGSVTRRPGAGRVTKAAAWIDVEMSFGELRGSGRGQVCPRGSLGVKK